MKVLFLSRYYHPHFGGVEKHLATINKNMVKKGFDITVITSKHQNDIKVQENTDGAKVIRIPEVKIKILGLVFIWINMFKYWRKVSKADVVHCHDVFIWYLPLRFLFPRKKVYVTFHGYETYPIKKRAVVIRRITEKLTDGNLTIGKFIEKWYGTKADIISYGAVDFEKFKPLKKEKYQYDAVFAGRLDEHTGILAYLDTVKELSKKEVEFKLLVLGDGKYKKKSEEHSKVLGWVKNPEKYFKEARSAFVNRYLAILEAFAAKKLVFAVYDNPVKEDYLKMTPYRKWIVIENDPKKLAERIIYYRNHRKEEKKMVNSAYKWVKNKTWEKMVDNHLKLWGAK